MTTFEVLPEKAELPHRTFETAAVGDRVEFVHADALTHLHACEGIAFCLLDAEKQLHGRRYHPIVPRPVAGGLLAADNATNHEAVLRPMLARGPARHRRARTRRAHATVRSRR